MLIKIDEANLARNPYRDFAVDPIDENNVAELVKSIKSHKFWGGCIVRLNPDWRSGSKLPKYQMVAGEHRRQGALQHGITEADLFVGDFDDDQVIHAYAVENATQRGATSLSTAGSVAAALRRCLREELRTREIARANLGGQRRDGIGTKTIYEKLHDVRGIGEHVVRAQIAHLKSSGDYDRIEREEIARYEAEQEVELKRIAAAEAAAKEAEEHRIAAEEQAQKRAVEAQRHREEVKAAKRAKQAAQEEKQRREAAAREASARLHAEEAETRRQEAAHQAEQRRVAAETTKRAAEVARAAKPKVEANQTNAAERKERVVAREKEKPPAFDMTGCGRVFIVPSHLETFRELVTSNAIKAVLPVTAQAGIARAIVQRFKDQTIVGGKKQRELTSDWITDTLREMVAGPRMLSHIADEAERRRIAEELERENWSSRWHRAERDIARFASAAQVTADKLQTLSRERPSGIELVMSVNHQVAKANLRRALRILDGFTEPTTIDQPAIENGNDIHVDA
jgi:ParB/RepB/Spo0J family partition protein